MKRITPEMVLEAYRKTELTPMQGDYFPFPGCACALGAIAAEAGIENNLYDWLGEKYEDYQDAFTLGFDGVNRPLGGLTLNNETAYSDGLAAWEAVKHLAISKEGESA